MSLPDLLAAEPIDLPAIVSFFDGLPEPDRILAVRSISGRDQARLYAAAKDFRALTLEHFVPARTPIGSLVRHYGKNSLPLFSHFEKRFARPEEGASELWGYNHNAAWLTAITGPGHFVTVPGERAGELHVDYYRIPPRRLPDVPPLRENTRFPDVFIYGNMVDVMRGVSQHVSIGRAVRKGKESPNYFLLCREERPGGR